jgi:DNA polymerase alpha-associated DNA helicase A
MKTQVRIESKLFSLIKNCYQFNFINVNLEIPLVLIDTSGCDMYEVEAGDDISKANEGEVSMVCVHVEQLIENGISPDEIAVITPYNLQVN